MSRLGRFELVPHYVAPLAIIVLVVGGLRYFVGNLGIWIELPIVVAIVFAYPTIVRWLGVEPSSWD